MKFAELNPQWLNTDVIMFDCPACKGSGMASLKTVPMSTKAQFELFRQKLGDRAGYVHPCSPKTSWTITDRNLETFTATPSLDIKNHWHKTITNGEIR